MAGRSCILPIIDSVAPLTLIGFHERFPRYGAWIPSFPTLSLHTSTWKLIIRCQIIWPPAPLWNSTQCSGLEYSSRISAHKSLGWDIPKDQGARIEHGEKFSTNQKNLQMLGNWNKNWVIRTSGWQLEGNSPQNLRMIINKRVRLKSQSFWISPFFPSTQNNLAWFLPDSCWKLIPPYQR